MITLFVEADENSGERLARTLAAMIPAVVEGVLTDAFVFNVDNCSDVARVTEAAGATPQVGTDLQPAIAAARGDWLLCIEPGARLSADWAEIVVDTLAELGERRMPLMRFRPEPTGFSIRRLFSRPRALRCGLIIHKSLAGKAKANSLEALARGRATRRIAARIVPAED